MFDLCFTYVSPIIFRRLTGDKEVGTIPFAINPLKTNIYGQTTILVTYIIVLKLKQTSSACTLNHVPNDLSHFVLFLNAFTKNRYGSIESIKPSVPSSFSNLRRERLNVSFVRNFLIKSTNASLPLLHGDLRAFTILVFFAT